MGMQANWFTALTVDDYDPFAEQLSIAEIGKPIDLSAKPQLNQRLLELLNEEAKLDALGVTCAVKDKVDSCCSACPIRSTDDLDPITGLCNVGVQQERVATMLAIHERRPEEAERAR